MSSKYKAGDKVWVKATVKEEVDREGDIALVVDGRPIWVPVDDLHPRNTAQPPGEGQGLKAIPNDKVHVTCLGHKVEFAIESLCWEGIGPTGNPSLTVRGRGPRGTRLEVQLLAPSEVPDGWGLVQGPEEHKP